MNKHLKYLLHILRDFVLYYVISGIVVVLVIVLLISTTKIKVGEITTEFITDAISLFVVILLFGLHKKNIRTELFYKPLEKKKIFKLVAFAFLARFVLLIVITGILFIASFFLGDLIEDIINKGIDYQWSAFDGAGKIESVLGFMSFVILGPIQEELFFRGVVFRYLRKHYSAILSIFYATVVFTLAHFHPGLYLSSFGIGLLLTFVYLRWNNIWYCIILHILFNLQPFIFMLIPGLR